MFLKNLRSLKAGFQLFSGRNIVLWEVLVGKVWEVRPTWICNNLTLAWTYSAPCTLSVYWILICRKYFFVIFAFYFRSYSPFWDGKVCLESLPAYSLSPINMIESGSVKKITGWTFVSGDKPIRVCLCYIDFCYISIHTKIYSLKSYVINFYTPMSSNQSESRSMFFFTCEKNDTSNETPQRCTSFVPSFPPLYGLAARFAVP